MDKPRLDPEEARAILRGERLAPSKIPIPSSTDAARSRGPTARLRALPPPEPGEASSEGFADGAGPATRDSRLQITWPPASAAVVSPPTMVRLAWTDGVTPQSLSLQSEGVELFAVPLAESDREVPLPEFGVMVRAGGAYSLSVEWTDPVGTRKRTAIRFRLLSEAERDRMRQDLYYLYEALGPRWNGRQGLMLRASAFAEYNCQGEAAALLLRYTALAPDDKEVYALLHHFFRALQQPDRADAALALASP